MRPETSFEALSERALEGVATPDERAKLESILASDPSLREQHELATEAVNALRSARLETPPPSLKTNVLRAVRDTVVAGAASPRRLPRLHWVQLLLPAAAGLAAGVILWGALTGTLRVPPDAGTSATMGAAATPARLVLGDADRGFSLIAGPRDLRLEAIGEPATIRLASPDGALAFGPAPGQPQFQITLQPGSPAIVPVSRRSPSPTLELIVERDGHSEPVRITL